MEIFEFEGLFATPEAISVEVCSEQKTHGGEGILTWLVKEIQEMKRLLYTILIGVTQGS